MLTSATVTPFDLVKTRQQVLHTTESVFTTMKLIYKEEGVHGLFRGLTPRIAQTIPSMSVMMIVYDSLNRFILRRQGSVCVDLFRVCYKHGMVEEEEGAQSPYTSDRYTCAISRPANEPGHRESR